MKIGKSFLGVTALAALCGLSLLGGVASAAAPRQAQSPRAGQDSTPHPVRLAGRVTSVSATGLVLQAPRGSVTVNAGPNTWIVVERNGACAEGTLQDVQTGRPAQVLGMSTTITGTVNARVISQARCAQAPNGGAPAKARAAAAIANHIAAGTVKAVNGSALTVTLEKANKDITVNTTAATVVLNNGFTNVSSVKAGDKVQVFGRPDKASGTPATGSQRSITAWGLRVVSAGEQVVVGRVDAVNGDTVTLKTPKNKNGITVTLDATTAYKSLAITDGNPSLASASQTAVTVGSNLIVEGAGAGGAGNLSAKAVIVLPNAKGKATK